MGACGLQGWEQCGRVHDCAALHCCGRPEGTVYSGGARQGWGQPGCQLGAPAPGGNAARSAGKHVHTVGSGKAVRAGVCGCDAATAQVGEGSGHRTGGMGRRGCAYDGHPGAGRVGRYGGSSGHTRCKCRASGLRGSAYEHAGRQPVRSARHTPGSGNRYHHHGHAHAAAALCCSGSSFHTRCMRRVCPLPHCLKPPTW